MTLRSPSRHARRRRFAAPQKLPPPCQQQEGRSPEMARFLAFHARWSAFGPQRDTGGDNRTVNAVSRAPGQPRLVAVQLRHGTPFPCSERRCCLLDIPARHRHRFLAQHFACRPAVVHPYGNVFPNTGRKFQPFSGKSFPVRWRYWLRRCDNAEQRSRCSHVLGRSRAWLVGLSQSRQPRPLSGAKRKSISGGLRSAFSQSQTSELSPVTASGATYLISAFTNY